MTNKTWRQFPYSLKLVNKFVRVVFPQVDRELAGWCRLARQCPDRELAQQALASIEKKSFHAQGGSIYALYPTAPPGYTRLIVALQTISDYLDNLCDRVGVLDEQGFRQLHLAMLDALDRSRPEADYYRYYPYRQDGGYLKALVAACRTQLQQLPNYHLVQEDVLMLAGLYCDLQTYKHLAWEVREEKLKTWANPYLQKYPEISCWEFAAATGSTLGIFMLGAMAADPDLSAAEVAQVKEAYFPWVCGLHILLDYFIDQEEDQIEGDLNFVYFYRNQEESGFRLNLFLARSLEYLKTLACPEFHRIVIQGLLAMYLSDAKAGSILVKDISRSLLVNAGNKVQLMHFICRLLRWRKII